MPNTMRAVRLQRSGAAPLITLEAAPCPAPRAGEVLVRVRATALTATELGWSATWMARDGTARTHPIPGHEFCGDVAELGAGVSGLRVGDRVFGLTDFARDGAEAEYAIATVDEIALAPRSVDDAHAAALPIAGLAAWQALFEHANASSGQTVLVHGAAGGVGSIAVQLASWAGARVIGTASTQNAQLARALGAQEVIDYTRVRFEDVLRGVDIVLDTVGGDTLDRSFAVLARGGTLVSLVSPPPVGRAAAYGVRALFFVVRSDKSQLERLAWLIDSGVLVPVVDAILPLARARDAYERLGHGHARGKTVLSVEA